MKPLLQVEELSIVYRTRRGNALAADQISFSLAGGQVIGLVGESGSGKSTIGAAIMGMLPDNAYVAKGRILFEDRDLTQVDALTYQQLRWKKIAMIFQAAMNALNPIQRVGDQIIEAIRVHEPHCGKDEARRRVEELYDQLSIPLVRLDDYPHQYSGGMRQRAIIAMALACRPRVIIADEPTTALDVLVQNQILKTIARLQQDLGLGILFISHDISVVADVCDQVGVLYAGQLMEIGRREEVFETPAHPYTQALLAAHITLSDERANPRPIPGKAPDICLLEPACRFLNRCTVAIDACAQAVPELQSLSPTHRVRCCRCV